MTQLTTVQSIAGFLTPALLFAILLALHIVLPAWRVDGYAHEKMFLYIFGGAVLALNAVSGAACHYGMYGEAANVGLLLHSAMWVWFVADYFSFERVQLYTFDIFEERLGFKLIFGCIVVYPCLYPAPPFGDTRAARPTAAWARILQRAPVLPRSHPRNRR